MILVGCDLHTRKQQVALLNTDTGELRDQELSHVGDDVERFYAALSPPVTVGIESTGYSLWFHALLQRLGHTLLVGEAAKIRAAPRSWSSLVDAVGHQSTAFRERAIVADRREVLFQRQLGNDWCVRERQRGGQHDEASVPRGMQPPQRRREVFRSGDLEQSEIDA